MTQLFLLSILTSFSFLFFFSIVVPLILSRSPTSPTATSTKTVNHGQRLFFFFPPNKTGVGGFVRHNLIADKRGEKGLSA